MSSAVWRPALRAAALPAVSAHDAEGSHHLVVLVLDDVAVVDVALRRCQARWEVDAAASRRDRRGAANRAALDKFAFPGGYRVELIERG